ncbi:MAG: hypothetical protein ACQKBV_01955, partial [Puniceicoccales bacterium]
MLRYALLTLLSTAVSIPAVSGLTQPSSAMPIQSSIYMEPLESVEIPRIRLSGRTTLQMNSPEGLEVTKPEGSESFVLHQRYLPNNRFIVSVYPNSSVSGDVTPESLTRDLNRRATEAERRKQLFEIIELPASEDEPSKLDFLGARPISATYAVNREIDGKTQKFIIMDSWAEVGELTYLVRIEAPADRFKQFYD